MLQLLELVLLRLELSFGFQKCLSVRNIAEWLVITTGALFAYVIVVLGVSPHRDL